MASWDLKRAELGLVGMGAVVEIGSVAVWEETVEWAAVACWWVEQEAELHTDLAHLHYQIRMELDYQIVAEMGMGLLVEADSDTAAEEEVEYQMLAGTHY